MTLEAPAATGIPQDGEFDHTLALLKEGYRFIGNRSERYNTDIFTTRLMGRSAICVTGEEAARMFYAPDRFTRQGALPPTALSLLQDLGSVATLNGEVHLRRKRMFMSLMSPAAMQRLYDIAADRWRVRTAAWERVAQVVLHDEAERILCEAGVGWADAGSPTSHRSPKPSMPPRIPSHPQSVVAIPREIYPCSVECGQSAARNTHPCLTGL
jgi:fatty-acid peroxygenase